MKQLGIWSAIGFLVTVAATTGCGDSEGNASGIPDACNPLGGQGCLLPWPSAVFLEEDATTRTGYRLAPSADAMPVNTNAERVDTALLSRFDGFSADGQIIVAFPGGVSPEGLPGPDHDGIASSVGDDAPIVLLDTETMQRVPFFAELDLNTEEEAERTLLIRPLVRMKPGTRHVVAIRKGVKAADGSDLPVPPAFQALLDGATGFHGHPLFPRLAGRAPAVFADLEAIGVPRSDLVLAWDFVTASDENVTQDLRTIRDRALEKLDADVAGLTFEGVEENNRIDPARSLRFVRGTFDSPLYLSNGDEDDSVLVRDDRAGRRSSATTAPSSPRWCPGAPRRRRPSCP